MEISILDVGQCGMDGPRIEALLQKKIHATVVGAETLQDAAQCLKAGRYDIVLVNRILAADGSSGLDVIEQLIRSGITMPIMLVSDRADAQDVAVKLGAVRGFGKAELGDPQTMELIKRTAGIL
jgi:DNA-binding NarL/FixJ family response regulator